MSATASEVTPRFKPGDRVRVRMADPPGHIRTPFFTRGKTGRIERYQGEFRHPEELAYGRSGLPPTPLYLVRFEQTELWGRRTERAGDALLVDIYENWLEPA